MRKLVILVWATVLIGLFYLAISHNMTMGLSDLPAFLKEKIEQYGYWSAVIFVAFGIIRPLLLIPTSLMLILGALLFGYWGIIYSLASEILASTAAFYLSRYLGHDFIENHTGERFKNFEHKLENHSFRSIVLLRLMFFVPNDLINYAAGASTIQYYSFIGASIVGTIPKAVLYNYSAIGIHDIRYLIIPALILAVTILGEKTIKYAYIKHKQKHLQVVAELGEVKI